MKVTVSYDISRIIIKKKIQVLNSFRLKIKMDLINNRNFSIYSMNFQYHRGEIKLDFLPDINIINTNF